MTRPLLREQLADLLYPSACAACGEPCVLPLCPGCFHSLARTQSRTGVEPGGPTSVLACVRSAGDYSGALKEMVLRLKASERRLAVPLASLMLAAAGNDPVFILPSAFCFVPSTRKKVAKRGYNPAALLAGKLSSMTGVQVVDALQVSRKVMDQDGLPGHARRSNVQGAYRGVPGRELRGDVVLVDDVLTTGATAEVCARELLAIGASKVVLLVAARAKMRNHPIVY
jgi:ComF family protein